MDARSAALKRDVLLEKRLDKLVPHLMEANGLDAWIIVAREYNEDPIVATMLPSNWHGNARRRTILVFKDRGRDRAAISRYPVGSFPSAWDPEVEGDQWKALADHLGEVEGEIGINISDTFALADGLTSTERLRLISALDDHRLVPAERLAIGWLETRLAEEVPEMVESCAIAHELLRRALSDEVIKPGETTTEDVAWWLTEQSLAAGYGIWFHPGVTAQRRGRGASTPADELSDDAICPGDLVHIDFGIVRNGYHTDQQQHGYVLGVGETGAPATFVSGMAQANMLQDILMDEMHPGRSGNDVLAAARERGLDAGIRPVIYTHPIGLHGHAAGSTIGLWDAQEGVRGAGDYPLGENTGWSIELAVELDIDEWDGQPGRIMLEEDAFMGPDGVVFLDGRQEEIWLIG